ncbi:MAG TPA: long-chain fatty aldehyde decarbonylase [Gammaproteobacteria bacterium]|jgi:hypothetical protein|nr:long-chain fatty aldehyde decarbonylase [Gammaproteobacteria bacterium]HIK71913.1 long-chain fatty aldehyde decarbonylase [Gammaproteobacteria bacterium]
MKVKYTEETPRKILDFNQEGLELSPKDVEDVAEIFRTPLTGAYNWDYTIQDNRISKLYELGKKLNWNASLDIDWDRPLIVSDEIPEMFWDEYPPYKVLSDDRKREFLRHRGASQFSQFLHGEQGALLVASQLVSCAPTYQAKLYAASQAFDEARHVEAFNRYIQRRSKLRYPIGSGLKSLLDKILTDERWDLKLIGMQIIIEGLALAAFNTAKAVTPDPVLRDILHLIIRDEARHVTFGVNYLEDYIENLSEEERENRALFAYEACVISKERLFPTDVFRKFGWNENEARDFSNNAGFALEFQRLLFSRVVPNLSRIGLLTEKIRPLYDKLGVLEFESYSTDADISWAELEKPLDLSA